MARPLLIIPRQNFSFCSVHVSYILVAIAAILSVFSVVTFLCGSNKTRKSFSQKNAVSTASESSQKRALSKLNSSISEKAQLMVKMISWKKMKNEGSEGDYDDDGEEAVWRRTIMMGERCRPLDFSGKIEYDSEGNVIAGKLISPRDQSNKIVPVKI